MSRPPPRDGAPASGATPPPAPAPVRFGADAGFEEGGVIGRGGMGEVRHAWDPWLHRDVALKTAIGGSPDAAARLVREARLTARLTHPNIIPVFSADHDAAGRPRYAMRLLEGKSLSLTLFQCADATARLAYVRNLLDVVGAVTYAHANGVLHADLSAGNVIVGAYGETLVADWGLAMTLEEAAGGVEPGGGTLGTRSPEQAAGRPLDARSDVYGLGALLYEILTGRPPRDAALGPVPSPRVAAPEAPPELAAIAERALAAAPEDRYPTAKALGDDLLAWFEGRRVSAHSYSMAELAGRVVRAWRAPLATAAIGFLAVLAVLVYGLARTARERDRALRAEAAAVAAQGEAESSLARALVAQANVAAEETREMDAEVLAAHALALGESPDARGVLAAFGGPVGLRSVARVAGPRCSERFGDPAGETLLCVDEAGMSLWSATQPDAPLATAPGHPITAAWTADGGAIRATDHEGRVYEWRPPAAPILLPGELTNRGSRFGASYHPGLTPFVGGLSVGIISGEGIRTGLVGWCTGHGAPRVGLVDPEGTLVVACEDASVVRGQPEAPPVVVARGSPGDGAPTALAWDPLAHTLVVGTATGRYFVLDGATGERRATVLAGADGIDALSSADGNVAVTSGTTVSAFAPTGQRLMSARAAEPFASWLDGGRRLRVLSEVIETWELGPSPLRRIDVGVGVATVDVDPLDRWIAVGAGDGATRVFDRRSGALLHTLRWQSGVVKDVAFSADGAALAVGVAGAPGVHVYDTRTWSGTPESFDGGARRVAFLADGTLLYSRWGEGLRRRVGSGEAVLLGDWEPTDLETEPGGTEAVVVTADHEVLVVGGGDPAEVRRIAAGETPTAADLSHGQVVVSLPGRIERFDPTGRRVSSIPVPGVSRDLVFSPDGSLFAVALVEGSIVVYRAADEALLAHLHGHAARVVGLAFTGDGRWLVSGSWDGTVRLWSVPELQLPVSDVLAGVESVWGREAADVLGGD